MKTNYFLRSKWSIVLVFTFAFVLCSSLGSTKVQAADSNIISTKERTINITGEGKVTVTPDLAYISLGVLTEKLTASEAESSNSILINSVIDSIKKQGIKDEDIKTTNYRINPVYDYDKTTGSSLVKGYTVSHTLTIIVRDINIVGQVIDTAVKSGANVSNSINFAVSDYSKYYNMALINALLNAQSKAQVISGFFNTSITNPIKITENSTGIPNDYPVTIANKSEASDANATYIQVGTFDVKANVTLVYQY